VKKEKEKPEKLAKRKRKKRLVFKAFQKEPCQGFGILKNTTCT